MGKFSLKKRLVVYGALILGGICLMALGLETIGSGVVGVTLFGGAIYEWRRWSKESGRRRY